MGYYLGIDLGGTNLRVAIATASLELLGRVTTPTPQDATSSEVTTELLRTVDRVCEAVGCTPSDVVAAGIGSVGPFDHEAGTIEEPANITETDAPIELVEPLRDHLGTETVVLTNDCVCGVIAEAEFAEQPPDNMVYLTISTGIGAGVIVDGHVLSGTDGNVAEVGHMTLDPAGRMRCGCGRDGHWEAYCGGANIPAYARTIREETAIETALPIDTGDVTTTEIFDAYGGDPLANRVVDRVGHWNALGVANVVQAFAPTEIAVGGAIALHNRDAVLGPITQHFRSHVMVDVPDVHLAEAGEDAVLYGAIISARERHADSD